MNLLSWWVACVGGPAASPLPEPAPVTAPEVVAFDAASVPASVRTDVVGGLRFRDANGLNVFVLSRSEVGDLRATHVLVEQDRVVATKRRIVEPRPDCDLDYVADFVPTATGVTDIDTDGLAEITFAYKYACRGDVSPRTYKVLVIEDGEKAILRGEEVVTSEGGIGTLRTGDGAFTSEGFEKRPAWLAHARTVWAENLETADWAQPAALSAGP